MKHPLLATQIARIATPSESVTKEFWKTRMHLLSEKARLLITQWYDVAFSISLRHAFLTLLITCRPIQMLYQIVVELSVGYNAQNDECTDICSFNKTTDVADPVKKAIDFSINSVQIEIEFKCDLHVVVV